MSSRLGGSCPRNAGTSKGDIDEHANQFCPAPAAPGPHGHGSGHCSGRFFGPGRQARGSARRDPDTRHRRFSGEPHLEQGRHGVHRQRRQGAGVPCQTGSRHGRALHCAGNGRDPSGIRRLCRRRPQHPVGVQQPDRRCARRSAAAAVRTAQLQPEDRRRDGTL